MANEGRLAQLATSPLLMNYAITASQNAIKKVGAFLAPLAPVPDLTFRYKKYTEQNRYRAPYTKRDPGGRATRIGFTAQDASATLEPNALDFPIPNVDGLSDEALQYAVMEAQDTLADSSSLALEVEIISTGLAAALAASTVVGNFGTPTNDPIAILDQVILNTMKAAKNGAPIKVLFGATAWKLFRNNPLVRSRFVVSNKGAVAANVGLVTPNTEDAQNLLIGNPEIMTSMMVQDTSAPGTAENISFILDTQVIVFASKSNPDRQDPSFMKTFARSGSFFKSGSYTTEDQRDQVLKMDWFTLPLVTNSTAAACVTN